MRPAIAIGFVARRSMAAIVLAFRCRGVGPDTDVRCGFPVIKGCG